MNKYMTKFMTVFLASALLIAAGSAMAQDHGDRGKGGKHQRGGSDGSMIVEQFTRELRQLGLSDEQKDNVKVIMQDLRTQSKSIGDDLRDNQTALKDVIQANSWDESAAAQLAAIEGDLTAQRTLLTTKALASVYAQLNAEQRAELADKAAERMERRAEKREEREERKANKSE